VVDAQKTPPGRSVASMSYLVLARKYRPQTFEEVIGQPHVTQTLSNAILAGRVAHAILLTGPRGTGKTTIARILAKAMNCKEGPTPQPCNTCRSCSEITDGHAADVFEIDGASNNSVDQVRELRGNLQYLPAHSRNKIYIIDEVHMLSLAAFNALLKTLEEPPPHVMFIFATTEPQKIPITILSRCQRHDLRRIGLEALSTHMVNLCRQEGFDLSADSLWLIAREAGGSVRDALSLLDQVLSGADGAVTDAEILNLLGLIDRKVLFDLAAAILAGNLVAILEHLEAVYQRGQDMRKLYADLVEHFRHLVVLQATRQPGRLVDLPEQELSLMRAQIEGHPPAVVGQLLELLFQAESQVRYASQPRLTLEMIFIRLLQARPALGIDTLIEKIDALQQGSPPSAAPPFAPPPRAAANATAIAASAPKRSLEERISPQAKRVISADPGIPPSIPPSQPAISDDPQAAWTTLRKEIEASKPALANTLANCQLTPDEGGGYTLTVTGNRFAVNSVQKNLAKLQSRFSKLTGSAAVLTIAQALSGDQMERREKRKKAEALKNAALDHPLVGEVVERFQGEVVEVKLL
jgi:DNA polymerase-3 subunit gamma/tau